MRTDYRSVYIAFDPHPSYKGASTHMEKMCEVLAEAHTSMLLLTLSSNMEPVHTKNIHHLRFETEETNYLKKARAFTHWAQSILKQQFHLLIGHYRDCWGGLALSAFPHVYTMFEVNGLPSIELPYRYPELAEVTLQKIVRLENLCLQQAKIIITPSLTTQRYLEKRGVPQTKIKMIPNGAVVPELYPTPEQLPPRYMVYAGALQPWQGVDVLLKSFRYLEDVDIPLVICSSYTAHHCKPYIRYAEKLGLADKIIWKYQLHKAELWQVLQHALFSVAPLTACSRNIAQGCSPLKILESMACGTAVIASQLPPVEEIITHNENGILCRPDRPADLARAIRLALDYPTHTATLGRVAKTHIVQQFTWQQAQKTLRDQYDNILTFSF